MSKSMGHLLVFAVLLAPAAAEGQPVTLVASGSSLTLPVASEGKRVAVWGGDALVVAEGPLAAESSFLAYDRSGAVVSNYAFSIPEADHTSVSQFARGKDGTLAMCGRSYKKDGRHAPFISWLSADGRSQQVVRTDPYQAELIAAASDGTMWTVGYEADPRPGKKGLNREGAVLRHFDRSGKVLGEFLPLSNFTDPSLVTSTNGYLVTSDGRIGWLHSNVEGEGGYIEISSDGTAMSYPLPQPETPKAYLVPNGLVMSETADVYAAVMFVEMVSRDARKTYSVFRLDRAAHGWSQARVSADVVKLYGVRGDDLVIWARGDAPSTVRFLRIQR